MQTDGLEFDPQESQWRYRWWKSSLVWTTLIVTAFLVYEITARPIWGVVVLCSKFGWGDFLTGFWLRRVDQNRARAKAFFWFHSAIGFFHVANAGNVLSILFCFLFVVFKAQNRAVLFPGEIYTAFGAFCLGILLSLLAAFFGFWHAIRSRLRVWLPYPHYVPKNAEEDNIAVEVLRALMLAIGFGCFEMAALIAGLVGQQGANTGAVVVFFALNVLLVVILVKLFKVLKNRNIAQTPSECWDKDVVGAVMLSQLSNGRKWRILAATQRSLESDADTRATES